MKTEKIDLNREQEREVTPDQSIHNIFGANDMSIEEKSKNSAEVAERIKINRREALIRKWSGRDFVIKNQFLQILVAVLTFVVVIVVIYLGAAFLGLNDNVNDDGCTWDRPTTGCNGAGYEDYDNYEDYEIYEN